MEQVDRLLRNAYLFEDPQSYQAGVRDAIAVLERSAERSGERSGERSRERDDAHDGRAQG